MVILGRIERFKALGVAYYRILGNDHLSRGVSTFCLVQSIDRRAWSLLLLTSSILCLAVDINLKFSHTNPVYMLCYGSRAP